MPPCSHHGVIWAEDKRGKANKKQKKPNMPRTTALMNCLFYKNYHQKGFTRVFKDVSVSWLEGLFRIIALFFKKREDLELIPKVPIWKEVTSEKCNSWLLLYSAITPKSEDKYIVKMFNLTGLHFSEFYFFQNWYFSVSLFCCKISELGTIQIHWLYFKKWIC